MELNLTLKTKNGGEDYISASGAGAEAFAAAQEVRKHGLNARERRVCVFCGSPGPLNKAHVIGRSFLRALPESNGGLLERHTRRDGKQGKLVKTTRESDRDPRERLAKVTCHGCNGQWMADIEKAVRDLVIRIASNERVELSGADRHAIAMWIAAAGVIAGRTTGGPDYYSADGAYLRIEGTLPAGFKVWMLYGQDRRDDLFSQHRSGLTRHGVSWLAWFWIGNTVFLAASEGAAQLLNNRLEGVRPIVSQLHPTTSEVMKWPPPAATFTGGISAKHMHAIGSI